MRHGLAILSLLALAACSPSPGSGGPAQKPAAEPETVVRVKPTPSPEGPTVLGGTVRAPLPLLRASATGLPGGLVPGAGTTTAQFRWVLATPDQAVAGGVPVKLQTIYRGDIAGYATAADEVGNYGFARVPSDPVFLVAAHMPEVIRGIEGTNLSAFVVAGTRQVDVDLVSDLTVLFLEGTGGGDALKTLSARDVAETEDAVRDALASSSLVTRSEAAQTGRPNDGLLRELLTVSPDLTARAAAFRQRWAGG